MVVFYLVVGVPPVGETSFCSQVGKMSVGELIVDEVSTATLPKRQEIQNLQYQRDRD